MSGCQKKLKQAFLSLLAEKPFDKITIKDIVEKAEVSRTSYYRHYYTQTDLLNEIIDDFFAEMNRIPQENGMEILFSQKRDWRFKAVVYQMLLCYKKHCRELKCILESNVSSVLKKRIYEYLHGQFYPEQVRGTEREREYVVSHAYTSFNNFYSAGFVQILQDWIVADCVVPPEEVLDFTLRLSRLSELYIQETMHQMEEA